MPRTSKAAMRERQALELRMAGLTFEEIAKRVGYASKASAKKAYDRAVAGAGIADLTDSDWRDLELHRLERAHAAVWPKAARGDLAAVREVSRLHRQRVQLRGLAIAPGRTTDRRHDEAVPAEGEGVARVHPLGPIRERRAADAAERAARARSGVDGG